MHYFEKEVASSKEKKEEFDGDRNECLGLTLLNSMTINNYHNDHCVSLNANCSRALSGSIVARLWDLKSGDVLKRFVYPDCAQDYFEDVSLSPDGNLGLTVSSGLSSKEVWLWNLQSAECIRKFKAHFKMHHVLLSSDGKKALSGGHRGSWYLWDVESGQFLNYNYTRYFSNDDVLASKYNIYSTYNINNISSISMNSDSSLALFGFNAGTMLLQDLKSNTPVHYLPGLSGRVKCDLNSDNNIVLAGDIDGILRIWDTRKWNECLYKLNVHVGQVNCLSLSMDGSIGLSGGDDGTLRLLDIKNGKHEVSVNYESRVNSLAVGTYNQKLYSLVCTSDSYLYFRHICASSRVSNPEPSKPDPSVVFTIEQLMKPLPPDHPLIRELYHSSFPENVLKESKETKEDSEVQITGAYKISYQSLKMGEKIGQGNLGVVYRGIRAHDDVAIKQFTHISEVTREEFQTEVQVMSKLRSKYIVQFYGYCLIPHYTLVMEFMPNGSLQHLLLNKKIELDNDTRTRIMTDIACGLSTLHAENIVYRDMKSKNVLLDEHLHAKLSNFRLSRIESETSISPNKVGESLGWLAPELLNKKHTKKSDIYSLGTTFWEIAARSIPYKDTAETVIRNAVEKGEREKIPDDCPKRWATVIQACWEGDPNKRPESDAIVAFFKSGKDDFRTFLISFMSRNISEAHSYGGNLNSDNGAANSVSLSNSSFERPLLSNLASGKSKQ